MFNEGVYIEAQVGVRWQGSVNDFELVSQRWEAISTEETLLVIEEVIAELGMMESNIMDSHQAVADEALTFRAAP